MGRTTEENSSPVRESGGRKRRKGEEEESNSGETVPAGRGDAAEASAHSLCVFVLFAGKKSAGSEGSGSLGVATGASLRWSE